MRPFISQCMFKVARLPLHNVASVLECSELTRKLDDVSMWTSILKVQAGLPTASLFLQGIPLCCHRLCCLQAIATAAAAAEGSKACACTISCSECPSSNPLKQSLLLHLIKSQCVAAQAACHTEAYGPSNLGTAMLNLH